LTQVFVRLQENRDGTLVRCPPEAARALVLKILREQRPKALSFALDAPARTFRVEKYADCKAGRAKSSR
jgi:hypothetical protein